MEQCSRCGELKPLEAFYKDSSRTTKRRPECIVCSKAYRAKNKDKINKRNKESYDAEEKKKYTLKTKEHKQNYNKEYWQKNKESLSISNKEYQQSNKSKLSKTAAIYRNTEQGRASRKNSANKRRETKIRSADGSLPMNINNSTIHTPTLIDLLAQQDKRCVYCGIELTMHSSHLDHIHPLSRGGTHTIDNVQFLCPTCNLQKGNLLESEFISDHHNKGTL